MAYLVEGQFIKNWEDVRLHSKTIHFQSRSVGEWVTADEFAPNRFTLVCGWGDPWSHRTTLVHSFLQLGGLIDIVYVSPEYGDLGWRLETPIQSYSLVTDLYLAEDTSFTGRVTIPLLWDRLQNKIVNNDSLLISKIFCELARENTDLYPSEKTKETDFLIQFIHERINNGVYKIGFSNTQNIYNKMSDSFFSALFILEHRLRNTRFLLGNEITLCDFILLPTLVRFNEIYFPCMKCTAHRLEDFPNLWAYYLELLSMPYIANTIDYQKIVATYYTLEFINPSMIIPNTHRQENSLVSESREYEIYTAPF
ncbi:MAG: glutathione S-transferase C-terminal domain-containing protein [Gammaproteobacteria bacterium]|nr:glutathione S-transferase C-terminal domain-containing protein [Gammaproteobacteria bacterium]